MVRYPSSAIARADENQEVHVRIDEGAKVYVSVHVLDEKTVTSSKLIEVPSSNMKE